ncbi:TonB-dependent receptor [Tistrella bauzanensis]|uniref:TonB-dependent receptor n=1 Tax=Tistrella TaxID=171436 RepID=UPI0031F5FC81
MLIVLLTGTVLPVAALMPMPARAQVQDTARPFAIDAQPLSSALLRFSETSRRQIIADAGLLRDRMAPALHGNFNDDDALRHLLAGTGLTHRLSGDAVIIMAAPDDAAGMSPEHLGPLVVSGATGRTAQVYETAAPKSYVPAETIERYRGSSPADMFRGVPGVMSGEARNGAGSIDVNIRGMQGMGRVAVTVDGTSNAVTVYQGYQGVSNRSFVDPDFLSGIDITRGSDVASSGIAGTVAMTTLGADDIVSEGENLGIRLKGGFGTNTASPSTGQRGGYAWPNSPYAEPVATASAAGMDRPSLLEPTSGSGSVVAALKEDRIDLVVGYAYRRQGNYHAGEHGPAADPVSTGPREYCYSSGYCPGVDYTDYIENGGIANYRAGEEVLNTQLETKSWLAKGTLRLGDEHSIQLGYNGFNSEAGDLLASRLTSERGQAVQQDQTAGAKVDAYSLKYRWLPDDGELIDLKAGLWQTKLEMRNPRRTQVMFPKPEDYGLPANYRTGSDTVMWGADVTNASRLDTGMGSLGLTYGLSYQNEDTRPSAYTPELENWLDLRDGSRQEAAGFVKAAWQPIDWLTVNGGLRYQHFWSEDRNEPELARPSYDYDNALDDGGFSPALGITVEPFKDTQFYVNWSDALRMPSIIESVSAFTMNVNKALVPERSRNWELGVNHRQNRVLTDDDQAMAKFGFFDWTVSDYIAREWYTVNGVSGLHIHNIDQAHFSGLEFSGRYEIDGFTAELNANYYLDVEFCRTSDSCGNKSLYADYATNQVPPEYMVDLMLSQRLFDDALTIGGRASHIGARAIGHGDVTAQGASQFISMIDWKPYTLVDLFAELEVTDNLTTGIRVQNLTDRYYVDPLSLVQQPGPGRTIYASATLKF